MEISCKTCIHKKVCDLWEKQECQNAQNFFEDECELYDTEPRWISVTEQLPNETNEYLVCYINGDVSTDWFGFTDYGSIAGFDEDIIAWMPLPEPYEGGDT